MNIFLIGDSISKNVFWFFKTNSRLHVGLFETLIGFKLKYIFYIYFNYLESK